MSSGPVQFDRKCNLIVSRAVGDGIDLGQLKVKFKVGRSDAETPNWGDITVYNVKPDTARHIRKEFTRVTLQGGYPGNIGVIFDGNIKQVRDGRENGTDTFISIAAADGDQAYNNATVSHTLGAGASLMDQIKAALSPMEAHGVTEGFLADLGGPSYPRGRVMYGMSRDYIRSAAQAANATWSIQNGKVQVLKRSSVLPGRPIAINSRSGLINSATQTDKGIELQALLNPMLRIGELVKLEQDEILQFQLTPTKSTGLLTPASPLSADGFYRLYLLECVGDTRDNDWYSNLVCLAADASAPAGAEVSDE